MGILFPGEKGALIRQYIHTGAGVHQSESYLSISTELELWRAIQKGEKRKSQGLDNLSLEFKPQCIIKPKIASFALIMRRYYIWKTEQQKKRKFGAYCVF